MSMFSKSTYKLLSNSALAFMRLESLNYRIVGLTRAALNSFLAEALSEGERIDLSRDIYNTKRKELEGEATLHEWENPWFERRLPRPPARILIGGAGTGREARVLQQRGYVLTTFEPAPNAVNKSKQFLGANCDVHIGSYEELNRAVLEREPNELQLIAEKQFDAIIAGWGSLNFVISAKERELFFQTCRVLCPKGPLLGSFALQEFNRENKYIAITTHGARRAGKALAWVRRIDSSIFRKNPFALGAGTYLSLLEIEALASAAKYSVIWETEPGYPHATFVPQ